jgi:hypothetical protein
VVRVAVGASAVGNPPRGLTTERFCQHCAIMAAVCHDALMMTRTMVAAVVAAGVFSSLTLGTPSAHAITEQDEAFLQYYMYLGGKLSGNDNAEEVIRIGKYFCNVLQSGGRQSDAFIPLAQTYRSENDRQMVGHATAAAVMKYCPDQLDSP